MEQSADDRDLPQENIGRRQLLKALAATGGAVTAANLVPGEWVKPVIGVGMLPVHAQTSPQPPFAPVGSLNISATWSDNNAGDIDLVVGEPTGELVHPFWGVDPGPTADHSGDNLGNSGSESVTVPPGGAAPGTYKLYLLNNKSTSISITVTITTEAGTITLTPTLTGFPSSSDSLYLADINFPGGGLVQRSGPTPFSTTSNEARLAKNRAAQNN